MKKFLFPFCVIAMFFLGMTFRLPKIYSDELDDITSKINDLNKALSMSVNATRPLESQLESMQKQITDIKARVAEIEADVAAKKKVIDAGYADLAKKELILNETIRDLYIQNSYNTPLILLLSANSASELTRNLGYQKAAADQDKSIITNIALSIIALEKQKQDLESEETRLAAVKVDLDEKSAQLDKIVQGAKAYQATLSNQIAQLTAQQQQLLAQKYATLNIPQSAYAGLGGGCVNDIVSGKDPGFNPKFGFFTFGVPNRVGLNQYGAKGRAEAGQGYQDILHAYYNADITSGYNTGITIHVSGTNDYGQSFDTNWNVEDYLQHVYEMPSSWAPEALKAQAIAARSYVLSYTNNGTQTICPDQHCQEVKQELNAQAWIDAVHATAGQVLTSGGQPIKAWFSSTFGGFTYTSADIGWSGTSYTKESLDATGSVNSFADLQSNAYDKGSPWVYCDWGSRSSYSGTAWLKSEEIADIANVILLSKADSSTTPHLSQADKPNPDGTSTWDSSRVKQELQNRGITPFSSVTSMSVNWDHGRGVTTSVTISGDGGSQTFDGGYFKTFFNLRAPANIQIVGPLYNAEQR